MGTGIEKECIVACLLKASRDSRYQEVTAKTSVARQWLQHTNRNRKAVGSGVLCGARAEAI
jgi:hypothetical protein